MFTSTAALLAAGAPDFAIVAVPTEEHLRRSRELVARRRARADREAARGDAAGGRARSSSCASAAGVHGAVGHVERFNPALLELRRRVQDGQLGEVFLIATERVGPFPERVRDVGVVKDLATHDLDLVRWLGGSPVERVAAQTQHRMGREHEDLVLVTGRARSGVQLQLGRRLAVADEGAADPRPRRARDARRRHADRGPDLLRERRT